MGECSFENWLSSSFNPKSHCVTKKIAVKIIAATRSTDRIMTVMNTQFAFFFYAKNCSLQAIQMKGIWILRSTAL